MDAIDVKLRAQGLAIKLIVQTLESLQPGIRAKMLSSIPNSEKYQLERETLIELLSGHRDT